MKNFFNKHKIQQGHIEQESFIDFATSRNRALERAEYLFPEATFLLMPDAEWYLSNVQGLINFCTDHMHDDAQCYLVRIINQGIDFTIPRLIRARTNARFVGIVHEVIPSNNIKKVPRDIFFELGVSKRGVEKSQQRWHRDLLLLRKSYEDNSDDPRTTFYLAQTYECLGELENAYNFYVIRIQQTGWIEETYEALYRLGRITEWLSKTNTNYTWPMAFEFYTAAHNLLPHRAEPLIKIAEHYWPDGSPPKSAALCYLFAKRAYELEYPENDLLFIDPTLYNFKRYELVSKSAWYVGDFQLGEICTRKALAHSVTSHLLHNLACYLERKKNIHL